MIQLHDLQAKSDQMNAVDFVKPMVFKVAKVEYFPKSKEQPIHLHLEGYEGRPYKPCKSMLRGLAHEKVWTMDETTWAGNLIELYCDPTVKWAGKESGGIRISGVSGINGTFEFPVQLNRSQRKIHTFRPLSTETDTAKQFVFTHWEADINEAESLEAIESTAKSLKKQFGEDALMQLKDTIIEARKKFQ